ncbi:hypothetical protein V3C99_017987 [Haemonchus contortus]|uniref:TED_complement domain-containing protein n=1 Tax=Haemonchus contortus TaxID=6289 RepID=A0A7I4Z5L9_HAECO
MRENERLCKKLLEKQNQGGCFRRKGLPVRENDEGVHFLLKDRMQYHSMICMATKFLKVNSPDRQARTAPVLWRQRSD